MSKRTTKDAKVALLGHVDLFTDCTRKELAEIASLSTEYEAASGQVLAREGELGSEFFLIVEGRATATRHGATLAELAPTDFFGELALLDGGPRTATVVAETPLHLLVLSRGEFKQLCQTYPSVSYRMLKGLGGRLRRADEMMDDAGLRDGPHHVTT